MKKKRLFSLILTICMVLSLVPTMAYAEDAPIYQKCFGVSFNPGGVDEQTEGKVQVQIGDEEPWFAEVDKDYFYTDGATPITFTLTPPAEGVGYTPDVLVMDGSLANVQPVLQENEGKYSFSIAPNAISGNADLNFIVWVSWCPEYDQFWPEDGQFMVETHVRGGEANGNVLLQPGTEKHKSFGSNDKYLFNRYDDANTLNVTLIPQPGIKLVAFRIGDQVYGDEPVDGVPEEDMQPLPELRADGQCTMTVSVPALSDAEAEEYIFVEAIFEAADPVAPPTGLRWDGKIAKWDAVEGADHYRITIFRGYTNDNGETVWHGTTPNSGIIIEECEFDYSNFIEPDEYTNNYFFRVCAIKDKVCSDEVDSTPYGSTADETIITHIAATITPPEIGATPDYHPVHVSNPENNVSLEEANWFKIAIADFTGTGEDGWDEMAPDEAFEEGYYYSVDLWFLAGDGYTISENATATVNGKPHDNAYGDVFYQDTRAYVSGLFDPLHVHVAGTEWQTDADSHWHICSVDGCGVIIEESKEAHSYGDDNVCDICGYVDYEKGDVTMDQTVNAADALQVLKAAVGKITLSPREFALGDMNEDGVLDAVDALAILKKAVGK